MDIHKNSHNSVYTFKKTKTKSMNKQQITLCVCDGIWFINKYIFTNSKNLS